MIDSRTLKAIKICVERNIPFACYMMPGEESPVFMADLPKKPEATLSMEIPASKVDRFDGFLIGLFELSPVLRPVGIANRLSVDEILCSDLPRFPETNNFPPHTSTDRMKYHSQLLAIQKRLVGDDEKTVLSRVVCMDRVHDVFYVVNEFFKHYPSCFRHIYYTHDTGLWFGATPELLLHADVRCAHVGSASVAGTRMIGSGGEWDVKNTIEHDLVTSHISRVLRRHCSSDVTIELKRLEFPPVEHLCHSLTAAGRVSLQRILPELSPTPAVCGWPREKAFEMIFDLETHQRLCYGGFVGPVRQGNADLFVNLRCASVHHALDYADVTIYSGGGITSRSDKNEEWIETEAKMSTLLKLVSDNQKFVIGGVY